ncbi:MAG: hypothetical protein RJA49_931 [Actinomycetota bacterium]
MNTFEAPPRTVRVADLPPPFTPSLPQQPKRATVASMSMVVPIIPAVAAPRSAGPMVQQVPASAFATAAATTAAPATTAPTRPRVDMDAVKRRVALFLVVMMLAAGGVYAYQRWVPGGPPHPDAWDPRVVPIVEFVQQARGLRFEHPIFVDFLTEAQYGAAAGGAASSAVADPDAEVAADASSDLLDAFGLAVRTNRVAADATIASAATLGYYTPTADRIEVRGDHLTPAVRVVLAHELTHALQAQHFDLEGRAGNLVLRAVAEADAMRIEREYEDRLPPKEQAAAVAGNTLDTESAGQLAKVPWPLVEMTYAPYALGPALVATVFDARGNDGVDLLFRSPPTEAQLLSPWKWSPGVDATAVAVTATAPPATTAVGASEPLSMLQLLVMLDAWLPWSMARGSLDTLQGAAFVPYRPTPDGPVCAAVTANFAGGAQKFAEAVRWWAGASASKARPVVHGDAVTFNTCPRGRHATAPPNPAVGPNTELLVENSAIPGTVRDQRAAVPYLCMVRQLIDDPAVGPLLARPVRSPAEQAVIDQASGAARQRCHG